MTLTTELTATRPHSAATAGVQPNPFSAAGVDRPAYLMCPPFSHAAHEANNVWMTEYKDGAGDRNTLLSAQTARTGSRKKYRSESQRSGCRFAERTSVSTHSFRGFGMHSSIPSAFELPRAGWPGAQL